jgi:hypothetical protein
VQRPGTARSAAGAMLLCSPSLALPLDMCASCDALAACTSAQAKYASNLKP